ncbi:RNA polymerase sigma factor [Arsenicibacter rosenii]|uniref:RNA polymerase subunit sigma-24 n=1 Tax=Arsenicibacter rosenii TaxID=1750698 RepID=A0A1S2VHP4_9BACT|nr:sigma-70 family RNA polymerase sigma factor [Arsenicibacter rosenii]OIN58262.1 hypothetical protein BLX24_14755 [Arsenicibacter rosenii]
MSTYQNESVLWNAFRQGDIEAFEQIYRTHSTALLSYGKRLSTDHDLVKDAIQDIFIEIWKRRENLRDLHTIKFYLFRVLRNRLTNLQQKALTVSTEDAPIDEELLLTPSIELILTEEETLTDQQHRLQRAIEALPNRQREAIMLAFFHNFSNDEIARIMGINHQSVINNLNRAFASLRVSLTDFSLVLCLLLNYF